VEEREMLTRFLSELKERPSYEKPKIAEAGPKALTGFPMRVFGEVFHAGDGVTAIVGSVEIPDGSVVDKPLVVKGRLKAGANCKVFANLKALGGVLMANDCSVEASIASGDIIELGENTVIEGDVRAESHIKLSEGAGIYGLVEAGGAYVNVSSPPQPLSNRRGL